MPKDANDVRSGIFEILLDSHWKSQVYMQSQTFFIHITIHMSQRNTQRRRHATSRTTKSSDCGKSESDSQSDDSDRHFQREDQTDKHLPQRGRVFLKWLWAIGE